MKIKILVSPLGLKEIVDFDENATKQSYLDKGYTEIAMGVAPQRTQALGNNLQAQRKQYGLKHYVTSTMHGAMGDTLTKMATQISKTNSDLKMWDKGQLVVILSRTKRASDS